MTTARRRSTRRRSTTSTGRRSSTPRWYPRRRRRRPGLSTTIGTALGTLAVTTLLDLSWPARLGLLALVVVLGLGYVLWRHRAEIAAGADADGTDVAGPADPADPAAAADPRARPADAPPTAPTDASDPGDRP